jgi:hypothetical protein
VTRWTNGIPIGLAGILAHPLSVHHHPHKTTISSWMITITVLGHAHVTRMKKVLALPLGNVFKVPLIGLYYENKNKKARTTYLIWNSHHGKTHHGLPSPVMEAVKERLDL